MLTTALNRYTRFYGLWVILFRLAVCAAPAPFIAMEHIGDQAAVPAAIFVFVCIITASLLPAVWARTAPDPASTEIPD